MKKLFFILFLFIEFFCFGQEVKPTGTNFKILQSPSFAYNLNDSVPWMYKSSLYGWNSLVSVKKLNKSLDSLKNTIKPIDNILHWDGYKYSPFSTKKSIAPGYPYFYTSNELPDQEDAYLTLDGYLSSLGFWAFAKNGDGYFMSNYSDQGMVGHYYNTGVHNMYSVGYSDRGLLISAKNYENQYSLPVVIGALSGTHINGEYISINDSARLFKINTTNIELTKGIANKWISLDANKNIMYNDPPAAGGDVYKGVWNANTNTPTLVNGTGTAGWYYRCTTAGTSLGLTFIVGDKAQYNGATWEKIPGTDYTLPYATASVLGGVKIGAGVSVTADATISVSTNYNAPLVFYEQAASNGVTTYSLPFTLKSTAQVFYNGYLLNNSRWAGTGTTTITLYIDPRLYDTLKIQN